MQLADAEGVIIVIVWIVIAIGSVIAKKVKQAQQETSWEEDDWEADEPETPASQQSSPARQQQSSPARQQQSTPAPAATVDDTRSLIREAIRRQAEQAAARQRPTPAAPRPPKPTPAPVEHDRLAQLPSGQRKEDTGGATLPSEAREAVPHGHTALPSERTSLAPAPAPAAAPIGATGLNAAALRQKLKRRGLAREAFIVRELFDRPRAFDI